MGVDLERAERLRDEYVASIGGWDESLEALLELDPDYFEKYLGLAAAP